MNLVEPKRFRLTPTRPERLPPPLEAKSQAAVVQWANWMAGRYPELRLLFAVPNAAKRTKSERSLNLALGMKAGVPDLILPIARNGFIGMAIEMKRFRKGKGPTEAQSEWLVALEQQGWLAQVCYGATEAIDALHVYVSAPPTKFA